MFDATQHCTASKPLFLSFPANEYRRMMMFRYFVYPVFLLNEIFSFFFLFFFSFFFRLMTDLHILLRHRQVYVAFLCRQ